MSRYANAKPKPKLVRNLFAVARKQGLTNTQLSRTLRVGINSLYNWKAGMPLAPQSVAKIERFLERFDRKAEAA